MGCCQHHACTRAYVLSNPTIVVDLALRYRGIPEYLLCVLASSSIVICTAKSRIYFCRVVFTKVQSPVDSYRTSVPSHPMIPKGVFHVTTALLLSPFGSMNTHLSDFNVLEL